MEKGMVVMIKRHCPYMSKKQLGQELGYSESTIRTLMKGFEEECGKRYSRYAVAENRYNFFAVIDYMKYKSMLADPATRKFVPEFDPAEISDLCGRSVRRVK